MAIDFLRSASAALICVGLAACGGGGDGEATRSGFSSVTSNTIPVNLADERNSTVTDPRVGLVALASGIDVNAGTAVALAGIRSGATVGVARTSGTATYDAQYQIEGVSDVVRTPTTIRGTQLTLPAFAITLQGDFDAGTLTGSDSLLNVDADINGTELSGDATLVIPRTIGSGALDMNVTGQIGSTGVIAAMHGSDASAAAVVGLVGVAR